jgi:PPOX class probable F420-dependent enzyme
MASSEVEQMLEEAKVAILASVDTKGRAHAAPIWYLYENGEFLISTGRGSQKHKNIEANPNVTLVIDRRKVPYLAAMVRGKATVDGGFSDEKRKELAVRYLGEEMGRRYVETTDAGSSVTIRLKPDKIIEYGGRAGR